MKMKKWCNAQIFIDLVFDQRIFTEHIANYFIGALQNNATTN
jgi:hypothetical protein